MSSLGPCLCNLLQSWPCILPPVHAAPLCSLFSWAQGLNATSPQPPFPHPPPLLSAGSRHWPILRAHMTSPGLVPAPPTYLDFAMLRHHQALVLIHRHAAATALVVLGPAGEALLLVVALRASHAFVMRRGTACKACACRGTIYFFVVRSCTIFIPLPLLAIDFSTHTHTHPTSSLLYPQPVAPRTL